MNLGTVLTAVAKLLNFMKIKFTSTLCKLCLLGSVRLFTQDVYTLYGRLQSDVRQCTESFPRWVYFGTRAVVTLSPPLRAVAADLGHAQSDL